MSRLRVRALRGDLFAPVAGEQFDLILANPPYLPGDVAPASMATSDPRRAWEGGHDGRVLIDRFCTEVGHHLAVRGTVALVQSSLSGTAQTLAALAAQGLDAHVVARRRGAFGPLAAGRASRLEARGIIAAGERIEELHVIVATRRDGHELTRRG